MGLAAPMNYTERAAWKKVLPAVARAEIGVASEEVGRPDGDGWEKGRRSGSVTRLDAVVACDTRPTFLVASCHHFLRGSMRAVSSLGQTWQRKKVFLWECRASSSSRFLAQSFSTLRKYVPVPRRVLEKVLARFSRKMVCGGKVF